MRLNLEDLRRVTRRTIDEARSVDALRAEIKRALGPSVIAEGKLNDVAASANDRITVLEMTGRGDHVALRPSLMRKFVNSESPEARRLAARTLPAQHITGLIFDNDPTVRAAAAKRLPASLVSEALRRFPKDYELRYILEAGLPNPKKSDLGLKGFDMYGDESQVEALGHNDTPELSEQWYKDKARKFVQDYGTNIEGQWEEILVDRYASSVASVSGVKIDRKKLYKYVLDTIEEREEHVLKRNSLKEVARRLREESEADLMREGVMPVLTESNDPVDDLLAAGLSPEAYVLRANEVFYVRESLVPASLRKSALAEGVSRAQRVPCNAQCPGTRHITERDERALDLYVRHWNARQALAGNPLRISWHASPNKLGAVSFAAEVK